MRNTAAKLTLISLLALAAAGGANAADTLWYAGGSIGSASIDERVGGAGLGASVDDSDTGAKLLLGYRLNEMLLFEASWVELGEFQGAVQGAGVNVNTDGFAFHGVGSIPVGERFSILARIGVMFWESDIRVAGLQANDDGTDIAWGLGASYRLADTIDLRAEWERYDAGADIDLVTVGGVVHF